MGKGTSVQSDPMIGYAAVQQAITGQEWLKAAKDQFSVANQRQAGIDALTARVTESQLAAQKQATAWAAEDRDRYKSVYQPLEDEYIKTAKGWDSAEKQASAASEAKADVMNAAAQQQQTRQRQMSAMGVSPDSGRFAGTERAADLDVALASAGAQNNARNTLRKEAVALKADAINMGKGLPSQATSTLGLGVSAGSSAAGTAISGASSANSAYSTLANGYSGAMSGWSGMTSGLNQQFQNQLAAAQYNDSASSGLMSGVGSVLGLGLGIWAKSSKDFKTDKEPADGSLDAVRKMPVERWTYKPGIADGGRHIGPYAEDFKKATGSGDGKTINMIDAIGVTMGAVQELADKVDKLAPARGGKSIGRRPEANPENRLAPPNGGRGIGLRPETKPENRRAA